MAISKKNTQNKVKKKIAIIPLVNGVIMQISFTKFLGIRFDDDYGDTYVYLTENGKKRTIHEYYPDIFMLVKDSSVSARELSALKKQIKDYSQSFEDIIDDLGCCPSSCRKNVRNNESDISMFA